MGATALGRDDAAVHISEFVAGHGSAATRAAYHSDLSLWLADCRGQSRRLFEARRADIEGYARQLEADGLAPATVNRRLATISGFYRWALDEGLVTGNPAGNVRRPRRPSDSPRAALSRTELKDWLDAAEAEGGHVYALACLWRSTASGLARRAERTSTTWPRIGGITRWPSSARATSGPSFRCLLARLRRLTRSLPDASPGRSC